MDKLGKPIDFFMLDRNLNIFLIKNLLSIELRQQLVLLSRIQQWEMTEFSVIVIEYLSVSSKNLSENDIHAPGEKTQGKDGYPSHSPKPR